MLKRTVGGWHSPIHVATVSHGISVRGVSARVAWVVWKGVVRIVGLRRGIVKAVPRVLSGWHVELVAVVRILCRLVMTSELWVISQTKWVTIHDMFADFRGGTSGR